MKQLTLILFLFCFGALHSQRIAVIESEYILKKVKTYASANERLDQLAQKWKTEIDQMMKNLDLMYKKFQAEQSLYTESMKQEKIKEIDDYEKSVADMQQKRFGPNGDLFQQRQQLLQPIVAKMVETSKDIATKKNFDMVLDKSGTGTIVYYKDALNISDDVVKSMGF